jgi:hypothetical protein
MISHFLEGQLMSSSKEYVVIVLLAALRTEPIALWHLVQRGRETEEVVAFVAPVTKDDFIFVMPCRTYFTQKRVNIGRYPADALFVMLLGASPLLLLQEACSFEHGP